MPTKINAPIQHELAYGTLSATGADEIDDSFLIQGHARVYFGVEKPSASLLTITCEFPGGAAPKVVDIGGADGVETGVYLEDRFFDVPEGTRFVVVTGGGVSGDKKVTCIARRVDA